MNIQQKILQFRKEKLLAEKENKIIADIILAKTELKVLKLDLGPGMIAMAATISAQYTAQVNLMRQNGATFTDILMMLTEGGLK